MRRSRKHCAVTPAMTAIGLARCSRGGDTTFTSTCGSIARPTARSARPSRRGRRTTAAARSSTIGSPKRSCTPSPRRRPSPSRGRGWPTYPPPAARCCSRRRLKSRRRSISEGVGGLSIATCRAVAAKLSRISPKRVLKAFTPVFDRLWTRKRPYGSCRLCRCLCLAARRYNAAPMTKGGKKNPSARELATLHELEKKVLWLASWTIHHANHLRENVDGVKVGGHQASSASLATIMTALYFRALRPQDRVAVKPHASPIYHAIQYLLGRQSRQKLEDFRGYKGAQSYPSRSKDADDVDFSTGSVGLGVAQTLFSSLVQDYVRAHGWGLERPEGRMIALVGDAELDEGNIFEALLEGWKQGLRNCWWIIDYNRQSLDAVIREGLWARYEELFRAFGWEVVILKYGSLLQQAFLEAGGACLREWIDRCPNTLYSALVFQGGAAWRKRLLDDIGDQGRVTGLIESRSDEELSRLMNNLAGHDLPSLIEAFGAVDHDRPVCFICYTIKGVGLPFAGHKDNHAGLMTPAQMEKLRTAMAVRPGRGWDK